MRPISTRGGSCLVAMGWTPLLFLLCCAILGAEKTSVEGRPFVEREEANAIIVETNNLGIVDIGLFNWIFELMVDSSSPSEDESPGQTSSGMPSKIENGSTVNASIPAIDTFSNSSTPLALTSSAIAHIIGSLASDTIGFTSLVLPTVRQWLDSTFTLFTVPPQDTEVQSSRRMRRREEEDERLRNNFNRNRSNEFSAMNSTDVVQQRSTDNSQQTNASVRGSGVNSPHMKFSAGNDFTSQHLNPNSSVMQAVVKPAVALETTADMRNSSSFNNSSQVKSQESVLSSESDADNSTTVPPIQHLNPNSSITQTVVEPAVALETTADTRNSSSFNNSSQVSSQDSVLSSKSDADNSTTVRPRHSITTGPKEKSMDTASAISEQNKVNRSKETDRDNLNGRLPPNIVDVDTPEEEQKEIKVQEDSKKISNKSTSNIFNIIAENLIGMMSFNESSKITNNTSKNISNNNFTVFKRHSDTNSTEPPADMEQKSQVHIFNKTYVFIKKLLSCNKKGKTLNAAFPVTSSKAKLPDPNSTSFLDSERGILDVSVSGRENSSAALLNTPPTPADVIQHISLNATSGQTTSTANTGVGYQGNKMHSEDPSSTSEPQENDNKSISNIWKIITMKVLGMVPDVARNREKQEEKFEKKCNGPQDVSLEVSMLPGAEAKGEESTTEDEFKQTLGRSILYVNEPEPLVFPVNDTKYNVKGKKREIKDSSFLRISSDSHENQLNKSFIYEEHVSDLSGSQKVSLNEHKTNMKVKNSNSNFPLNSVAMPQKIASEVMKTLEFGEPLSKEFSVLLIPSPFASDEERLIGQPQGSSDEARDTLYETAVHAFPLPIEITDFSITDDSSPNIVELPSEERVTAFIQELPPSYSPCDDGTEFVVLTRSSLPDESLSDSDSPILLDELTTSGGCRNNSFTVSTDQSGYVVKIVGPEIENPIEVVLITPDEHEKSVSSDSEKINSQHVDQSQNIKTEKDFPFAMSNLPQLPLIVKLLTNSSFDTVLGDTLIELSAEESDPPTVMASLPPTPSFLEDIENKNSSLPEELAEELIEDVLFVIVPSPELTNNHSLSLAKSDGSTNSTSTLNHGIKPIGSNNTSNITEKVKLHELQNAETLKGAQNTTSINCFPTCKEELYNSIPKATSLNITKLQHRDQDKFPMSITPLKGENTDPAEMPVQFSILYRPYHIHLEEEDSASTTMAPLLAQGKDQEKAIDTSPFTATGSKELDVKSQTPITGDILVEIDSSPKFLGTYNSSVGKFRSYSWQKNRGRNTGVAKRRVVTSHLP